ncbi:MAG: hypothetical protein D6689_09860 [Deltaproteobacteria bacterium]|nr:MAG: hypothetical protein D6689_09860 [Deltaproteobacteria bacterium]
MLTLSALAGAAGCNETTAGAQGNVLFTPDRCDLVGSGCTFDDSVAVGGTLIVHITGAEGSSTAGFDLQSDDPTVLSVQPVDDVGGKPTWELAGTGAGVARLVAVDPDGNDVDFLEVSVQEIDNLGLVNTIGDAVGGPVNDPDYHEIWTLNAGVETWFHVEPRAGTGRLMGVLQYDVVIDDLLDQNLVEGSDVVGGFYKINAPAGNYTLSVTADNGTPLDVLFQVQ